MAFGFPAYHTERYTGAGNAEDMRAAARSTLKELAWAIRDERSDGITASASISLMSWGERIVVTFLPDGSISVTSKCAWPLQCVDWGKNKTNVRKFMSEIRKRV
jgi:acetamidase/formamidase